MNIGVTEIKPKSGAESRQRRILKVDITVVRH